MYIIQIVSEILKMRKSQQKPKVVISGMSGAFPGCKNIVEFKEKLFSKEDLITVDTKRWNTAHHSKPLKSGRVPDAHRFDFRFLGMHPMLALRADPLAGPAMEKAVEAMFDAGVNPFGVRGRNIAVISASSVSEAEMLRSIEGPNSNGQTLPGMARTMVANRISFHFNFTGPSYNLDNSWVSAFQGLEMGARLVAEGAVDSALVTAPCLIFHNIIDYEYNQMGVFSQARQCSPFDSQADGFVRGEAVVAFYVQRAESARRQYCTLRHAEVSCLGDRDSRTSYLGLDTHGLASFLGDFYRRCGVDPSHVAYIETFGSGIKCYDVAELNAMSEVFGRPLLVGSVSGHTGLTECPSGFVSLAKAVVAMDTGLIPPTLHYHNPNTDVPALLSGHLKPVTEVTSLPEGLVGVTSLGFSGPVGHVLLEPYTKTKHVLPPGELPSDGLPRLVILQFRHEEDAQAQIKKFLTISVDVEYISLVNEIFKIPIPSYPWRGFSILPASDDSTDNHLQAVEAAQRPVWFVFSGMGCQWPAMAHELLALPVFAAAVNRCDKVLSPLGVDLRHILTSDDPAVFNRILNCFVGITAVQIGLVDILNTLGVFPDGMVGHSAGEVACGYADGCLSAEQTVLAAYARGKVSEETELIKGMMAAVGLGYSVIKEILPPSIDVACHNSFENCSLSGPAEDVNHFVEKIKSDGVFAKAVNAANIAFHSRYIRELGPNLMKKLNEIIPNPKKRSSRWVSSSVPESQWHLPEWQDCSPAYYTNNILSPVLFQEACLHVPENAIMIEIAPHGLLQAILKRALPSCVHLPLTRRSAKSNLRFLLSALGKLHLNNVTLDINALYPKVDYPVSRGTPSLAPLITWDHRDATMMHFESLLNAVVRRGTLERSFPTSCSSDDYTLWKDYKMHNQIVLPLSELLMYPWKMISDGMSLKSKEEKPVIFENVTINQYVPVTENGSDLYLTAAPVTMNFEFSYDKSSMIEKDSILLSGNLHVTDKVTCIVIHDVFSDLADPMIISQEQVYLTLTQHGLEIGPRFRGIRFIRIQELGCCAKVQWNNSISLLIEYLFQIITYFQVHQKNELFRLAVIQKLTINSPLLEKMSKGEEMDVFYDCRSNQMICKGIEMLGVVLLPSIPTKEHNFRWTEENFNSSPNSLALDDKHPMCNGGSDHKPEDAVDFNETLDEELQENTLDPFYQQSSDYNGFHLKCIGLNLLFAAGHVIKENDWGVVDYVGLEDDELVMGVGWLDKDLVPDQTLRWAVPSYWSVEDAVTVPAIYCLGYFCCLVLGRIKSGENVLVTDCLSLIGQAVTAVALHQGANVIVTVQTKEEKTEFVEKYPRIKPSHVIVLEDMLLTVSVKRILGPNKHIDVIINSLVGDDLSECNRLIFGLLDSRFVHIGDISPQGDTIGLYAFCYGNSFYGANFTKVLNSSEDVKRTIVQAFSQGIQQGIVTPFKRQPFPSSKIISAKRYNQSNGMSRKTVVVDPKHLDKNVTRDSSFIQKDVFILAGKICNDYIDFATWLGNKGVQKLVLISDDGNIFKVLKNIQREQTMLIHTFSLKFLQSLDEGIRLLERITHMGNITSIICLAMDENSDSMRNLDQASRKVLPTLQQFVTLLGEGSDVCTSRREAGLPVLSVKTGSSDITINCIQKYMQYLIFGTSCKTILLTVNNDNSCKNSSSKLTVQDHLPMSLQDLYSVGMEVTDRPGWTECRTRSLGYSHVRHSLLPVFVVTVRGSHTLRPLLTNLIHPAFCSTPPHAVDNVLQHAHLLMKELTKIQTRGPYNIVGEGWGGGVALTLGRLLEGQGHLVELFLLEGAPVMAQERLTTLGKDLATGLLVHTLCLTTQKTQALSGGWTDKLLTALATIDQPQSVVQAAARGLTSLYDQLLALQSLPPPDTLFTGPVTLVTAHPSYNNDLSLFCLKHPRVVVIEADTQEELLSSPSTAKAINEHCAFDWWN